MANTNDLVDCIINDAATREKISNIIARSNPTIAPIEDLSILEDSELQYGDLTHLLTLAVNGNVAMKEQKQLSEAMSAKIEYKCFVGGLAWATTDQILHEAFSQYGPNAQTNFTKPPVSKQHTRDAKCHFVVIDIFNGKKLEDIVPSSHNCDVPHVNHVDYQLIDISEDGFVSLLIENGNTKDDLRLPTDDSLPTQIKDGLGDGKDLVVSVMPAMGEEQICALKDIAPKN
ncbi:eukaryotic translation initiation factor 5A family protein [Salix suchowensis]|nr:eukaryotic translation initiation factor 5A family protein [Salix suchowensis]